MKHQPRRAGFNGPGAVWLDPSATNAPMRFYRAVGSVGPVCIPSVLVGVVAL